MLRHFDEADVRAVLHWDGLITAIENGLADFSSGLVLQPVRNMLEIEADKRYLGIMPAVTHDAMGLKLISFYPGNAGTQFPTHMATILLFRPATGEPLAVMDGRLITEMRTAAVSAAATKRLTSPGGHVLALLGSGVQAKAHLEALSQVREFDDVRVWSRTPEHAKRFAEQHGVKAMDAETAVRCADVIVAATNAHEPILMGAWRLSPAHNLGSFNRAELQAGLEILAHSAAERRITGRAEAFTLGGFGMWSFSSIPLCRGATPHLTRTPAPVVQSA